MVERILVGIPLNAMHVLSAPFALLPAPAEARELEARALHRLREWAEPYPHAVPEVRWGSPAQCLVEAAGACVLLVIRAGGSVSPRKETP